MHVTSGLGKAFVLARDKAGETSIADQIRVCHSFGFKKQQVSSCFLFFGFFFIYFYLLVFAAFCVTTFKEDVQ